MGGIGSGSRAKRGENLFCIARDMLCITNAEGEGRSYDRPSCISGP